MTAAEEIHTAYRRGAGAWSGCNWPTRFGSLGIDLEGVSSALAGRLARRWLALACPATAGERAALGGLAARLGGGRPATGRQPLAARFAWEWDLAAAVLAEIEHDARDAEREAQGAFQAAEAEDWPRALLHAGRAAAIEAGYHAPRAWRRLRRAIQRAAGAGDAR